LKVFKPFKLNQLGHLIDLNVLAVIR